MNYPSSEVENSFFGYIPNLGVNAFAVTMACLLLLYHVSAGVFFRQWWFGVSWTITMLLELIGYSARLKAREDIHSRSLYEMHSICLVIAPIFMAAGLYYLLAKYIQVYGQRYSPLRPMAYSAIFISCDVFALFLQGAGGGLASGNGQEDTGKWILIGGTVLQSLTLIVFFILHGIIIRNVRREKDTDNFSRRFAAVRSRRFFPLLAPFTMVSSVFVLVRSIYRSAEFGNGLRSSLITTERYFLILDGLMILIGALPFLIHPGAMLGTDPIPVKGVHKRSYLNYDDKWVKDYDMAEYFKTS